MQWYPLVSNQMKIFLHSDTEKLAQPNKQPAEKSDKTHFVKTRTTPIPAMVFQSYKDVKYQCKVGTFPSISRAWITMDNKLFIWNYMDGGDCIVHEQGQVVRTCCLVPLSPSTTPFEREITHLLVVATATEILLVAVGFINPQLSGPDPSFSYHFSQMRLHRWNLRICTTVGMTAITCSDTGRIFCGGLDGSVFEVTYTSREGWEGAKVQLWNLSSTVPTALQRYVPDVGALLGRTPSAVLDACVDNVLKAVYTVHKFDINVWDLGVDGKGNTTLAGTASLRKSMQTKIGGGMFDPKVHSITRIFICKSQDSDFVTVCTNGDRFYWKAHGVSNWWGAVSERANCCELTLFQESPTTKENQTASGGQPKRTNITSVFIAPATCLMVNCPIDAHNQKISETAFGLLHTKKPLAEYSSTYRQKQENKVLIEVYSKIPDVSGATLNVSELPMNLLAPHLVNLNLPENEIVTHHIRPAREFVIVSNQGVHFLTKLRPVDQLRALLNECTDLNSSEILAFQRTYGNVDTCCMLIILLCQQSGNNMVSSNILQSNMNSNHMWPNPTSPQLGFGGSSQAGSRTTSFLLDGSNSSSARIGGGTPSRTLEAVLMRIGSETQPTWQNQPPPATPTMQRASMGSSTFGSAAQSSPSDKKESIPLKLEFSTLHTALWKFFTRIVAPFWGFTILLQPQKKSSGGLLMAAAATTTVPRIQFEGVRFTEAQLQMLIAHLNAVKQLMASNPHLTRSTVSLDFYDVSLGGKFEECQFAMKKDIQKNLDSKDARNVEACFLCKLQEIVSKTMEAAVFVKFLRLMLPSLTTTIFSQCGQDKLKAVGELSLEKIVMSNNGVHHIQFIISELIRTQNDPNQVTTMIDELDTKCALLFKDFNIREYRARNALHHAKALDKPALHGVLTMFLDIAHSIADDIECIGRQFCEKGYPQGAIRLAVTVARALDPDNKAQQYYNKCSLQRQLGNENETGFVEYNNRNKCYTVGCSALSANASDDHQLKLLTDESMEYDDPLWHHAVFKWFIDCNKKEKLPHVKSVYLEQYLEWNLDFRDCLAKELCMFCDQNGKHERAANIFVDIAMRPTTSDVPTKSLDERLSLLSNAMNSARMSNNVTLISGLQQKMETAKLQHETLVALRALDPTDRKFTDNERHELEANKDRFANQLVDIQTVFQTCRKYQLHETVIGIYAYLGRHDDDKIFDTYVAALRPLLNNETQLNATVQQLARRFADYGPHFFPIPIVLSFLEVPVLEYARSGATWKNEQVLLQAFRLLNNKASVQTKVIYRGYRCLLHYLESTSDDGTRKRVIPQLRDFNAADLLIWFLHINVYVLRLWITELHSIGELAQYELEIYNDFETLTRHCAKQPSPALANVRDLLDQIKVKYFRHHRL